VRYTPTLPGTIWPGILSQQAIEVVTGLPSLFNMHQSQIAICLALKSRNKTFNMQMMKQNKRSLARNTWSQDLQKQVIYLIQCNQKDVQFRDQVCVVTTHAQQASLNF